MRILFAGIIARYPFGGVTWCSLMYLLGLRALGHEVFYIEDTGECVYDPIQNSRTTDPSYGTSCINNALTPFGLGDRWTLVNYDGTYHGCSADQVRRYCADAGANKDREFMTSIALPSRTRQPFELAVNGPQELLREHGWETVDAMAASRTPWDYRDFIHRSKAEFGVAKHTYVATCSGWFSD